MNIIKKLFSKKKPAPPDAKTLVFRSWLIREHNLIQQKRSDLSATERRYCEDVYNDMVKEGKIQEAKKQ